MNVTNCVRILIKINCLQDLVEWLDWEVPDDVLQNMVQGDSYEEPIINNSKVTQTEVKHLKLYQWVSDPCNIVFVEKKPSTKRKRIKKKKKKKSSHANTKDRCPIRK